LELSRDSFVEGILQAVELDGGLYRLFPNFFITTLIGNPLIVGDSPGWDMEQFQAVLKANPQADMPLGDYMTRARFFESMLYIYMEEFIDKDAGTADFDNERFINLLESMSFLPSGADMEYETDENLVEFVTTGRRIMHRFPLMNVDIYQVYRKLFGGEIVFKGFPTDGGDYGSILFAMDSIAMTVTCSDKDGAWDFIHTIVTEDKQRRDFSNRLRDSSFFPVNKSVFDEMIENAQIEPEENQKIGIWFGMEMDAVALTPEESDRIRGLIAGVGVMAEMDMGLWGIVSEEANKYFNDQISAQDAVKIIQSRASIYMSEQYG